MNWVVVSLGIIVSSVVLYLAIRKLKDLHVPLEFRNLAMFALPALLFFTFNRARDISFVIEPYQFGIIFISAVLFSWLGNIASLRALELAPNQGYSLIISKSYVVMTAILSVWLFDAPLTSKDILAILLIIGFSVLIMIDKKESKAKGQDKLWLWLTMGAFFAWGFLALTLRYLTDLGIQSTVILFYLTLIVSIIVLGEIVLKKVKVTLNINNLVILGLVGIASTFFNLGLVLGYSVAPNPGYINAVNAGSIALVTIFSALIFKDELTPRKMVGILGVMAGLGLLFI